MTLILSNIRIEVHASTFIIISIEHFHYVSFIIFCFIFSFFLPYLHLCHCHCVLPVPILYSACLSPFVTLSSIPNRSSQLTVRALSLRLSICGFDMSTHLCDWTFDVLHFLLRQSRIEFIQCQWRIQFIAAK